MGLSIPSRFRRVPVNHHLALPLTIYSYCIFSRFLFFSCGETSRNRGAKRNRTYLVVLCKRVRKGAGPNGKYVFPCRSDKEYEKDAHRTRWIKLSVRILRDLRASRKIPRSTHWGFSRKDMAGVCVCVWDARRSRRRRNLQEIPSELSKLT